METLSTLARDESPLPKLKKCNRCGAEKPFTLAQWGSKVPGKPSGGLCRPCEALRKRENDVQRRNRDKKAALVGKQNAARVLEQNEKRAALKAKVAALAAAKAPATLKGMGIEEALRDGAQIVNANAAAIVLLVAEYAKDPDSPHHEWALKLMAERAIPAKLFTEVGLHAAGVGGQGKDGAKAPTVHINVIAAPGPGHQQPAITVKAIEERAEHEPAVCDVLQVEPPVEAREAGGEPGPADDADADGAGLPAPGQEGGDSAGRAALADLL